MRKALVAMVLLAGAANAESISFSQIIFEPQFTADGRFVSFATTLSVPQFDPLLGTLDSIGFSLSTDAILTWQASRKGFGTKDYNVLADLTFLGVEKHTWSQNPAWPAHLACGIDAAPAPCTKDVNIGFFTGTIRGTITEGQIQFAEGLGPLTGSLSPFIGTSSVLLPVTLDTENYAWFDITGELSRPDPQMGKFGFGWTYNYTPGGAAVPEPSSFAVAALSLLGLIWRRRTRSSYS